MKDLRALLIDCRIELRKLSRDFQKSELCERIDLAIQSAATGTFTPSGEPPVNEALLSAGSGAEKGQTVSQVALAWQTAARDLKFSDPQIHSRLSEKVIRLLSAKTLVDPGEEILQLEKQVAALRGDVAAKEKAARAIELERDAVLGALATKVPTLKDGGDRLGVALARVDWLVAAAEKAGRQGASSSPTQRAPDPQDAVPTPELLAAAAAGATQFTKEQREWCVGEAMVVTGFQFTPVELIEKGDAAVAKLILDARKSA
jgi:hypothetical protein